MNKIHTTDIVPVDLNSIMYSNELALSDFHSLLGDPDKALSYREAANSRKEAIRLFLWNETESLWFDFHLDGNQITNFYASNLLPLWCKAYDDGSQTRLWESLKASPIFQFAGGIPTSLVRQRQQQQQWDFPNAWSPLQLFIIEGLESLGLEEASEMAISLSSRWVNSNFAGWMETQHMYEKYDVTKPGHRGEGGEYEPQTGFGWTNGVALELLKRYGSRIKSSRILRRETKQIIL